MSASISASVRGFIARKGNGCSRSLATVSCLYGTEPITNVGFNRRMSSTDSMCQQSPSFGSFPTGATWAHHFVTPTRSFFAPIAHKMDVALGARETMRCRVMGFRVLTEPSLGDRGFESIHPARERSHVPKRKTQ